MPKREPNKPRGPGRPPEVGEPRIETLRIRVTPKERLALEKAAARECRAGVPADFGLELVEDDMTDAERSEQAQPRPQNPAVGRLEELAPGDPPAVTPDRR